MSTSARSKVQLSDGLATRVACSELELSVAMARPNEADRLLVCVERSQRAMGQCGIIAEVMVADHAPIDGSVGILEEARARVVRVLAKRYGNAGGWHSGGEGLIRSHGRRKQQLRLPGDSRVRGKAA